MEKEKLCLYNISTGEKEVVKPDNNMIGMYVCVAEARSAVVFDILYRYLMHLGYAVEYVPNLTNFSDMVLINQANKPSDFTRQISEDCLSDLIALQCHLPKDHQTSVHRDSRVTYRLCEDSGVTYWLHNANVTNSNFESLRVHNSVTIRQVMNKYHPLALRHFLLSTHYRSPLTYSVLQLESSSDALVSVYQTLQGLAEALPPLLAALSEEGGKYNPDVKAMDKIEKLTNHLQKHLSDDLNTDNIFKGAFEEMMRFISKVIKEHKKWQSKRLMPMVLSLVEIEKAVKEFLDVLGLLTTHSCADFLKEMKQMTLARAKLGAEEILHYQIDLRSCHWSTKKILMPSLTLDTVELMQYVTPGRNVVYYVRKFFGSESEARNEYEVMSILHGSIGVVQCLGKSIHKPCPRTYAFFMEYAPAGTLFEEIQRHNNSLPIDQIRRFTQMILQGLQSVHQAGFVHGDLHSGNVLLFHSDGGLDAKISDFGRSKRIGDSSWWSDGNRHLGHPSIMSPESVSKGITSEALDVWAVGLLVDNMFFLNDRAKKKNLHELTHDARDFMSTCLEIEPERRARVDDLLQHEFLLTH